MDPLQIHDFTETVRLAIALLLFFGWLFAIIYIIWWGMLMIFSWGAEEKVKVAVNHIRHAVIGLVFMIAMLFIVPKFLDIIGLEGSKYAAPSVIYSTIRDFSSSIFHTNGSRLGDPSPANSSDELFQGF